MNVQPTGAPFLLSELCSRFILFDELANDPPLLAAFRSPLPYMLLQFALDQEWMTRTASAPLGIQEPTLRSSRFSNPPRPEIKLAHSNHLKGSYTPSMKLQWSSRNPQVIPEAMLHDLDHDLGWRVVTSKASDSPHDHGPANSRLERLHHAFTSIDHRRRIAKNAEYCTHAACAVFAEFVKPLLEQRQTSSRPTY